MPRGRGLKVDYKTPKGEEIGRKNPAYIITPAIGGAEIEKRRLFTSNAICEELLLGPEIDTISIFTGQHPKEDPSLLTLHAKTDGQPFIYFGGEPIFMRRFVGKIGGEVDYKKQTFGFDHYGPNTNIIKAFTEIQMGGNSLRLGFDFDFTSGESSNVLVITRDTLSQLDGPEYEQLKKAQTPDPHYAQKVLRGEEKCDPKKPLMAFIRKRFDEIVNDVTKSRLPGSSYFLK